MSGWWRSNDWLNLNVWGSHFLQWISGVFRFPDCKVAKGLQTLLSGESWRVDLGSRAAAGTALLPPPPPQTVRTVAAGVGPLTLHSSSVQKNCRKSSVFLPWVLCALYQHYRHFQICAMPWVPGAVGILTAYLKARPSMHWPMIIRQYI